MNRSPSVASEDTKCMNAEHEQNHVTEDEAMEKPAKDPQKKATPISKLFFSWLDPLIWLGYKRELTHQDLYATPEGFKSQYLSERFNKYWRKELKRNERGLKPRLWFALFQCFKWTLLLFAILYLFLLLPFIGQAILVGYLSQYFCDKNSLEEELTLLRAINNSELVDQIEEEIRTATRDAYIYAAGITLISCLGVFTFTWAFYVGEEVGTMHRIALVSTIYSKVLRLSQSTIGQLSIGHIVNLCSNDVQRFDTNFEFINELWVVPLFIPVVIYLLWREIGPSCLAALAIIVIQPPLQFVVTRFVAKWRLKSAKVTDERVKVMNEIISGMRLIKMYAWEWAFHEHVKKIRKKESRIITQASLIYGCNTALFYTMTIILSFVTFSTYAGLGNALNPQRVFTSLILLNFAKLVFSDFMIFGLLQITELSVSLKRIEKLLLLPELGDNMAIKDGGLVETASTSYHQYVMPPLKLVNEEFITSSGLGSSSDGSPHRIVVTNLTASWTHEREKLLLNNVSFTVDKSNRLLAVVGPVGSGKSSILQCLLREIEALDGSVDIEGSVSYASQEPWIFSGTFKENILFGEEYEETWFRRVVECCSLVKDIDDMPFGDETLIGERGVNLSGGQKARVNLARNSDIMLLDDPLSAVDAAVGRHLFDECICGVLADKLVVLVTHQLQYAQHANSILVLKQGCVQGYGDYSQLTSSGVDPTELFNDIKDSNKSPQNVVFQDDSTEPDKATDKLYVSVRKRFSSVCSDSDLYLSDDCKFSLHSASSLCSLKPIQNDVREIETDLTESEYNTIPEEERAHGTISNKTYFTYLQEGGNTFLAILLIVGFLVSEGSVITTNWWLSNWASGGESCSQRLANISLNDTSDFDLTTHQRIGIFGAIVTGALMISVLKGLFAFITCLNASRNLHNKMFSAILRAPILFFDTNPVGRVLNRFSADTGLMDILLPVLFVDIFSLLLNAFSIVVVASVANYWLTIPAAIVIVSLLLLRHYFLHASRNIQRLEATARSPLYSHISATIQGLTTIRAYKEQGKFVNKLHFYQNEHSKGWYAKMVTSRWFGLRIDLIGAFFIAAVMFSSLPIADTLDPALVGLSMFYAMNVSGIVQFTIRTSALVENLLVSVERVIGYGKLEPEAELMTFPRDNAPPLEWPENGAIEFHNVNFRYAPHYPYVLKSLSLKVESCEKVGVVGRTGAGKSSLLAALFRLAEPEGVIEIDGVEINEIGLHDLRKKMSIIPQDPVLFSGTVRYNLDPFNEHEDDRLWDTLNEVQLKDVVLGLDGGLDAKVSEGGSNFSVGQRQLICLARALLRRNQILVIDEATANVDPITDGIIQEMIRTKFIHCTILTIAHRLETIMDSDRILVLSSGKVIEYDTPYNLLQTHNSVFSSMVERTGPIESVRLKKIVKLKKIL
ncbi:ATP-binding cassette sub-family C member 4-like isoform X2 [Dysidea avara]|uniref:ATP-binding cassette sub-family C member 4-like isoform X2 n=1 Tax=Dysidea avara TaxID=196820 RepID=UPI0033241F49